MTTLCDCESVINSRPITYVSDDSEDLMPLTPAMYLQELREIGVPDCDNVDRDSMVKRLRYRQKLRDDLRRRFRVEYLGKLFHRNKSKKDYRQIRIGEVVMIGCDNKKRLDWPLARVIETIAGRDGEVRVIRLKTATGEVLRPIQRVYPLELSNNENDSVIKEKLLVTSRKNDNFAKNAEIEIATRIEERGIVSRPAVIKQDCIRKEPKITRSGRNVKKPVRFLEAV